MAMAKPTIISSPNFMNATKSPSILKRGRQKELQIVDTALRIWHLSDDNDDIMKADKLANLQVLITASRSWLQKKLDKDTPTANVRRQAITALLNQAMDRMAYHYFHVAKKTANSLAKNSPKKGLSEGYEKEREQYVDKNKKKNPLSASSLHHLVEDLETKIPEVEHAVAAMSPEVQALLAKNVGELTLAEYNSIYKALAENGLALAKVDEPMMVRFFTKAQRLRFMYWVQNKVLVNADGPMDTGDGVWMYAMDQHGNLFATAIKADRKGTKEAAKWAEFEADQKMNFNHSSFNAGKDIICAGMIKVDKGKITEIDNNSGHYKPTGEHLNACVAILRELGMEIADNKVKAHDPG